MPIDAPARRQNMLHVDNQGKWRTPTAIESTPRDAGFVQAEIVEKSGDSNGLRVLLFVSW